MAHFREQASRRRSRFGTQQAGDCQTITIRQDDPDDGGGDTGDGENGGTGDNGDTGNGNGGGQPPDGPIELPVIGPLTLQNPRALGAGAALGLGTVVILAQ